MKKTFPESPLLPTFSKKDQNITKQEDKIKEKLKIDLDKLKINIIKASEHLSPWNSVNEAERKAAKKRGVQLKKNIIEI